MREMWNSFERKEYFYIYIINIDSPKSCQRFILYISTIGYIVPKVMVVNITILGAKRPKCYFLGKISSHCRFKGIVSREMRVLVEAVRAFL